MVKCSKRLYKGSNFSIRLSKYLEKYDPFQLKGMKETINRIVKAINEREKIVIYGYYDVDSIASVSILLLILRYFNADVEYFIPEEISYKRELRARDVVEHIEFLGTDLIITVGCGITSVEEVELCKMLNIDVIILEHQNCSEELPNTIIVNPKQQNCSYSFKDLSCSGVTLKLVQALGRYYKVKSFYKFIDLAMLGTISSDVPIIGENKVIIDEGISQLYHTNNYGIKALIKIQDIINIDLKSISTLVYSIMPTMNAIGRMDNAKIVVELFTTNDSYRAEQIAKYLNKESNSYFI